jgi:regulator of protease activity HflC (stomatin/prohibitin superfamily)
MSERSIDSDKRVIRQIHHPRFNGWATRRPCDGGKNVDKMLAEPATAIVLSRAGILGYEAVRTTASIADHWRCRRPASAARRPIKTTDEDAMDLIPFVIVLLAFYALVSLRVLKQYERGVVFLLGKFAGVRGPGLTLIFVPIQQMVRVSLRTVTMQIPSQKIITKDNVSIDIAAVAYYHITDPEKAVIAIENVYNAINQISQTTVRNVVGRFSLDQLLSDTASINDQIKNVIDQHTEPWGTQVTAVEIKDITLPDNMQRAMAKEAEAERERRAKIVAAEGEYQAAVKLGQAADIITQHPVALQLRTLQTMAEISVEKNSTIIFPAQFMTTVQEAIALLSKDSASK